MKGKLTAEELRGAKRVVKEWKIDGDINLLAWIDYQLRLLKDKEPVVKKKSAAGAVKKLPNTVESAKRFNRRQAAIVKSKTTKK